MKQLEVKRRQIEYLAKAFEVILFLIIERKLGLEGCGFFLVAIMLFLMLWTFVGENLPDVLGKMIRIRKAKGQYKSIRNIRWYSFLSQLVLGAIGAFLMFGVGTYLGENVFGCPYSSLMIWILSPLLFLRGISFLLLGYCQGEGSELPSVVACVLRLIATYVFGVVLGTMAGEYGEKVSALLKLPRYTAMYMGAGWCVAIVMAELVVILFLFCSFLSGNRRRREKEAESMKASVSFSGFLGACSKNVIFRALICFLELFPVVIGMMMYYHREGETAPLTYGTYFVGYFTICILVYRLLNALAVPFWGKVSGFFRRDEVRLGRVSFHGGIHLLMALSMILSVGITAMPAQVGSLAGFTSPNVVKIVVQGSFWIVFASLGFYFSRMLMRFGKNLMVIGIGILCDILFVMLYKMLWSDEKMGLLALMYASLIAIAIYAILLGAMAIQLIGGKVDWFRIVLLPAAIAGAIGILQALCVKFIGEHLEALYVLVLIGGVGFVAYWCILLLLRNFSEEELSVMPFGGVLLGLGKMLGVF